MSRDQLTPAGLRARAVQIRGSAQYAQGETCRDELKEARELERKASELEQQLNKSERP